MPVGPLMIEHRLIERMIAILDKHVKSADEDNPIDLDLITQGTEFLRYYADHCHHGKEEEYLFKALEQKELAVKHQRILNELIEEHGIARATVKNLVLATERASRGDINAYQDIAKLIEEIATLYPPHIEKEDKAFFLPIMSYFSQAEKDAMLQQFAQFDQGLIHEHYRLLVDSLESSPSLNNSNTSATAKNQDVYECSVCGYKYDPAVGDPENGIKPGTPFAELPDSWVCPLCKASKDMFNKLEDMVAQPATDKTDLVKEYQNQDIIVYWYPQLCSHAGKCWDELPKVFKPEERPWIDLSASTAEELIRTIDKCPSRALKYSLPEGSSVDPSLAKGPGSIDYRIDPAAAIKIRVIRDGPLLVEGPTRIFDSSGNLINESDRFVLCRCGKTLNSPFCDGSHIPGH